MTEAYQKIELICKLFNITLIDGIKIGSYFERDLVGTNIGSSTLIFATCIFSDATLGLGYCIINHIIDSTVMFYKLPLLSRTFLPLENVLEDPGIPIEVKKILIYHNVL